MTAAGWVRSVVDLAREVCDSMMAAGNLVTVVVVVMEMVVAELEVLYQAGETAGLMEISEMAVAGVGRSEGARSVDCE